MVRLSRWQWIKAGFIAFCSVVAGFFLYGWRRYKEGRRVGEVEGRAAESVEEVQSDLEARDGAGLYRRGKEWIERK